MSLDAMTALYGIVGDARPVDLRRMGDRLQHRGRLRKEWTASPGLQLGVRYGDRTTAHSDSDGESPPVLVDGRVMQPGTANAAAPLPLIREGIRASGPSFFAELRGPFAIVVVTGDGVLLARDPHGYRQLYYMKVGSSIYFASEYKALLSQRDFVAHPDPEALQTIHRTKNQSVRRACIRGVRPVPSGCYVDLKEPAPQPRRYWTVERPVTECPSGAQAEELRKRLLRALELHLADAGSIGVALSGGLDSAVTLAGIRQVFPDRTIHTFSAGYGPDDPELVGAAEAASHFNTEHHELTLAPDQLPALLPEALWHIEEPVGREDIPYLYHTCRVASSHVEVLVSGYDADLLFGGMPRHLLFYLANTIPPLRPPLRGFLEYARFGRVPSSLSGRCLVRAYYRGEQWPAPRVVGVDDSMPRERWAWAREEVPRPLTAHLARQAENTSHGPHDALHKAFGLEMYSPFGDQGVIDWAFRLPDRAKIRLGSQKRILRDAFGELLPEPLRKRGKTLQRLEHGELFSDVLEAMADELLHADRVQARGLIEPDYVERVKRRPPEGDYPDEQAYRLWTLLMTEMWAMTFLDRPGDAPLPPIL